MGLVAKADKIGAKAGIGPAMSGLGGILLQISLSSDFAMSAYSRSGRIFPLPANAGASEAFTYFQCFYG